MGCVNTNGTKLFFRDEPSLSKFRCYLEFVKDVCMNTANQRIASDSRNVILLVGIKVRISYFKH